MWAAAALVAPGAGAPTAGGRRTPGARPRQPTARAARLPVSAAARREAQPEQKHASGNRVRQQKQTELSAPANNIVPGLLSAHPAAAKLPTAGSTVSSEQGQPTAAAGQQQAGTAAAGSAAAGSAAASQLEGLHRPVGMALGSAWLLATAVQLAGGSPWFLHVRLHCAAAAEAPR